jgi:carnitine O-acetyltransferase
MGEHSVMDGTPTARMCDEMLDDLYSASFDAGAALPAGSLAPPEALDWNVGPETLKSIERATSEARALVESQVLGFYNTSYGKKVHRFSI